MLMTSPTGPAPTETTLVANGLPGLLKRSLWFFAGNASIGNICPREFNRLICKISFRTGGAMLENV